MGDLKSFQARYIALRQAIVLDGMSRSVPFSDKDLQTISERILGEGTSFVKVTLPLLGKALDRGLVTGRFECPANFRTKRNTCLPVLCHGVFSMIFDSEGILSTNPNLDSIFFLRQFLLLDAKLITESTPEQNRLAVQGFKERQEALRKKSISPSHPVLERAITLLGKVLNRLDLSDIAPGHGPGAVAERIDRFERWDFTYWPLKAEKCYPYLVYGTQSLRASLEKGVGIPLKRTMRTRCCLVPKDFKGPRLISAEGAVNQYLQQGQMKAIMQYIDKHPVLGRSIKLRDQSQNQRMASTSFADNTVTLDLSNASDTVSTVLVWNLLSKVPKLRRLLMSTRSDFMTHEGQDIKITAFAPMGSATCFPVETLVFWSLSMASIMLARRHATTAASRDRSSWNRYVAELSSQVSVFGDDIIIPSDALDILVSALDYVGCTVNSSKTCYRTPFRESCGAEWMNGSDVTIIRNRRYHYEDDKKFKNHPVLCGLQRKFFLRGLYRTADLLCSWAREIYPCATVSISSYPERIPEHLGVSERESHRARVYRRGHARSKEYSQSYSPYAINSPCGESTSEFFFRESFALDSFNCLLGWQDALDSALPSRWNRDYQHMEVRCLVEHRSSRDVGSEGYSRLLARLSSDTIERIVNRDRKIKLTWSSLPFISLLSKSIKG